MHSYIFGASAIGSQSAAKVALAGLLIGTVPALAAIEQCRFIQAKPEREACYQRQEAELAARRKPEPAVDTRTIDSLQQMRRDDDEVYKSLRSICRGC
jgi:hypothetical protein